MQSINARLYYCHPCQKSVMINYPNLVCPECGSDFLQEAKMPEVEAHNSPGIPILEFLTLFSEVSDSTRYQNFLRALEQISQNQPGSLRSIPEFLRALIQRNDMPGPASDEMIQNLQKEIVEENEVNDCKICTESFKPGDEKYSLQCEHEYHVSCLSPWLKIKSCCPFCRQAL